MIGKLLCLCSNAQNFMYFMFICHYLCHMNFKWLFPSQKSLGGRERQTNALNVLGRIQHFTMLTMKTNENSMQGLKKKKKGKKPWKNVTEAQRLKWRTQKQIQKTKKQLELAANLYSASEFSIRVAGLR